MESAGVWQISLGELEAAVRAADPAALLVPGRILRRVIKQDRHIAGAGLSVPHRKTYLVSRDQLLQTTDYDELGLSATTVLPETIVLLARPEAEKLAAMTRSRALVKYWRLLYHARIHQALEAALAEGRLTVTEIESRFDRLGDVAVAEIRDVLDYDQWLMPPADAATLYVEFVAVFYELRHFAPRLLPDYFPSLNDLDAVDALLRQDFDARGLFDRSRLAGAPDPHEVSEIADDEASAEVRDDAPIPSPRKQSEQEYCHLMEQADRARSRGNLVRSSIRRMRAALVIGPKAARAARREAHIDLEHVAQRLQQALDLGPDAVQHWSAALVELLPRATEGLRSIEARLLNDIQKVCVDHERGVYTVDLVAWIKSRFRQPLTRPLPALREVYIVKHLRSAESRLGAARLAVDSRRRLSELLHVALSQAETRLRDSLRPRIGRALDQVELRPANVPETVARSKLIEELLDTVVDRGFLTLGDLRDAISRNNLKIRDLTDWREAMAGDQLLETDKRLAELLDGVYRRGELYRRIPQALSSLAFGTPRGRALTRYGFVPYGGAFLLVAFYDYVLHELRVISGFGFLDTLVRSIVGHSAAPGEPPPEPLQMSTVLIGAVQIVVLGTFLLGMLYNPEFRARVIDWSRTAWKGLKFALFELPTRLLEMPAVQAILNSRAYQFFRRFVFKPLLLTLLLLSVKRISTGEPLSWLTWLITFGSLNLLLNSRLGRNVDEMVTDWVVRGWHQLRMRVFAAALRLVIDIFSQMLDALERLLYAVDEWLRFRRGDSQLVTFVKAVLGAAWSVVTFVIRFCVTLLIEPQVNPIKHFPVVTVSHKIILPLGFPLVEMLAPHLGAAKANTLVWSTIWLIPGIFGFLVWELKENWRLFAANRPTRLEPVMIGSHGETMVRLLRPGFHSGTIPKLFARLRRADRKAYVTGQWAPARKLRDRLSHAVLEVRHFVERELIVLLEQTALWPPETWRVGGVDLGQRRIAVAIECRGERDAAASTSIEEPLMLVFEDRDGWLMASLGSPNWLSQFNSLQTEALSTALAGLLKLAGIQLRRDVLDDGCAERRLRFQLNEAGFVLRDAIGDQARYERDAAVANLLHPLGAAAEASRWPVFDQTRLYCGEAPISWARWVEAWHEPQRRSLVRPADDAALLAETV